MYSMPPTTFLHPRLRYPRQQQPSHLYGFTLSADRMFLLREEFLSLGQGNIVWTDSWK